MSILGLDILAARKACEEMPAYQRSDCPFCGYQLETAVDGLIHCKWCGWTDAYPLKRDVPRV